MEQVHVLFRTPRWFYRYCLSLGIAEVDEMEADAEKLLKAFGTFIIRRVLSHYLMNIADPFSSLSN